MVVQPVGPVLNDCRKVVDEGALALKGEFGWPDSLPFVERLANDARDQVPDTAPLPAALARKSDSATRCRLSLGPLPHYRESTAARRAREPAGISVSWLRRGCN